jgi:hypothetical protein
MAIDSGSHLKSNNVQNDRHYDRYTFEKLNMHTFCNFENPENSVTLFFFANSRNVNFNPEPPNRQFGALFFLFFNQKKKKKN